MISKLVQGEYPTLLEASKGNELIDALNLLMDMEVRVGGTGKSRFLYSEGKIILFISKAELVN